MKSIALTISLLLCNIALADIYCPQQVVCSGYTPDTCTTPDLNWHSAPVPFTPIDPGIYKFIYAMDYHHHEGPDCFYMPSPNPKIKLAASVSASAQMKAGPHLWHKEGMAYKCFSPHDPSQCPFIVNDDASV